MAAHFELNKASNGRQFYFLLKAGNGEIILTSEMYESKASAENGIASVQANSADPARYVREKSKDDKHYFLLRAGNHQTIGTSQRYASAAAMETGIASVQKNGSTADIRSKD
jgi:hypothetical protein